MEILDLTLKFRNHECLKKQPATAGVSMRDARSLYDCENRLGELRLTYKKIVELENWNNLTRFRLF